MRRRRTWPPSVPRWLVCPPETSFLHSVSRDVPPVALKFSSEGSDPSEDTFCFPGNSVVSFLRIRCEVRCGGARARAGSGGLRAADTCRVLSGPRGAAVSASGGRCGRGRTCRLGGRRGPEEERVSCRTEPSPATRLCTPPLAPVVPGEAFTSGEFSGRAGYLLQ